MCARIFALAIFVGLSAGQSISAAQPLDWDVWEHMPVLHRGRVKPLDTYARSVVQIICGRENPQLSLDGAMPVANDQSGPTSGDRGPAEAAPLVLARALFPDGKAATFNSSELVFSWLVEPEKWERVPFLAAANEDLRRELDLPIMDSQGNHLKYASPWDVAHSDALRKRLEDFSMAQQHATKEEKTLEPTGVDKKAQDLWEAYWAFRTVSFHPETARGGRQRLREQISEFAKVWAEAGPGLERWRKTVRGSQDDKRSQGDKGSKDDPVDAIFAAVQELAKVADPGTPEWSVSLAELEPIVARLQHAAEQCALEIDQTGSRMAAVAVADTGPLGVDRARVWLRGQIARTADLAELARQAHYAIYDDANALYADFAAAHDPARADSLAMVPALTAAALEKNRDSAQDVGIARQEAHALILARPWLSLHTVILGSKELLKAYPEKPLSDVRAAFAQCKAAYLDREDPQRTEKFAAAMRRFAAATRALSEAIEPLRRNLPIKQKDEALMAATAYPVSGALDREVEYNRIDPFSRTWEFCLAGVVLFSLGFGYLRKPMFWLGIASVAAGLGFTVYGLATRVSITRLAPVTNMFETVVYVSLVVAILGLWFNLLPLFGRGLQHAWRLTAVPVPWEAGPLNEERLALFRAETWRAVNWAMLLPRAALGVLAFLYMADCPSLPYASGYIALDPGGAATFSNLTAWGVGLCLLGLAVYYLPRAILALVLSPVMVPYTLAKCGVAKPLEQVVTRRAFAASGAAVAFLAAFLAYFIPTVDRNIFDKNINPVQPVLRDNFWLTSHVLTITASYGAGALAWGLGNIALAFYLFGRYRPKDPTQAAAILVDGREHRAAFAPPAEAFDGPPLHPPEACGTLGTYIYKATQVAVVLLAAGTILGALWADKSWGRFWGWDPKEVWALVSCLVYLAILHGRFAGWFGNFGLTIGSVIGATAILLAWYGVNFVFGSGLHSYGDGTGGKLWVLFFVALNWLYVLAAAGRYKFQTRLRSVA
ncbi:MAG: cytochrome c biogenesis protein [Thermoguttaceae bacterium]